MEIEGRIEAISYKNKGIKVNGRWFNIPEEMIKNLSKNQIVKLIIDDYGNVMDIEVLGTYEEIDNSLKIEALKSSIEILKLSLQYGVPDFVSGAEVNSYEKIKKKLLKELSEIYTYILALIK